MYNNISVSIRVMVILSLSLDKAGYFSKIVFAWRIHFTLRIMKNLCTKFNVMRKNKMNIEWKRLPSGLFLKGVYSAYIFCSQRFPSLWEFKNPTIWLFSRLVPSSRKILSVLTEGKRRFSVLPQNDLEASKNKGSGGSGNEIGQRGLTNPYNACARRHASSEQL